MDRTESGFKRSGLFAALYCLPAGYVLIRSAYHTPTASEAPMLLSLAFGGFVFLVLACTTILPRILRRLGQANRADVWRRAAFVGIDYATLFTFMWTIPFIPMKTSGRIAGLAAFVGTVVVMRWADRRWLHFDLFKWRR